MTFAEFRAEMLAGGYDEVLERPWAAGTVVEQHAHPFEAKALVVAGEMWLAVDGAPVRHLGPGDWFHLAAGLPHTERYGAEGATYWVGRRAAA